MQSKSSLSVDVRGILDVMEWAGDPPSAVRISPEPEALPRTGLGHAIGHHGEILQGVFEQSNGLLARGLVTLTVPRFASNAIFRPGSGDEPLIVEPGWKAKSRRAAELMLARLGQPCCGLLTIDNNIAPRWGFGSSTSDVVATVRAVAMAFGHHYGPEAIAEVAVQSETASDSTMFGERVILFAQRRGVALEDLGASLPMVHVIGFNLDPTGWGVDTLMFPPARYTWWEIEAFRPLLGLLRRAVRYRDVRLLGYVATASARINQRHLPKPQFDELERITDACGGVGLQVAHSGSIAGILLPCDESTETCAEAVRRSLAEIGIASTWCFTTGL